VAKTTGGMGGWLDFERPLVELERRIHDLRALSETQGYELWEDLAALEKRADRLRREIYSKLTPWQRVQLARHPKRPYSMEYIGMIADDFIELHGDRLFRDDAAIVTGLLTLGGRRVCLAAHQKGRDMRENIRRNFGSAYPEGYRKALRVMQLGARFRRPIVTLIDTAGAYPGVGAEERGQANAIARNLFEMAHLPVPIVSVVLGEGGSGGALGIGVADVILMLENSIYSVISPEGCAAILWADRSKAPQAAEAMRMTAPDLMDLGIIDGIIPEPLGGAHRNPQEVAGHIRDAVLSNLARLDRIPVDELLERRIEKYWAMGVYEERGEEQMPEGGSVSSAEESDDAEAGSQG
jgi:acetyl-CoA carboxylase carboxyl transferase subunit alpha